MNTKTNGYDVARGAISRRHFLVRGGAVFGAAALGAALPRPVVRRLGGDLWLPEAFAGGTVYDPVPDPIEAGWQTEGTEQYALGQPLRIFDDRSVSDSTSPEPFRLFFTDATSLFQAGGDVVINPSFQVFSVSEDRNGNCGAFVAITDGFAMIRAVLFRPGTGFELRIQHGSGFSDGVPYWGGPFTLRRRPDLYASLEVPGQSPLIIHTSDLVQSPRSTPTIEFGTYPTGSACTMEVFTLGLPARRVVAAVLDIEPDTLDLSKNSPNLTAYVEFPNAAYSPADIDLNTVTLQLIAPFTSSKLGLVPDAQAKIGDGNHNGVADLNVKFDRRMVGAWFTEDTQALFRVEGQLADGTLFRGHAEAQVIAAKDRPCK